ncbi:hypothetical protein G7046_g9943 [Stylonectria norvegica]|nr:hypothetical protein G7046_g9943 [Stylonectria norvegica]
MPIEDRALNGPEDWDAWEQRYIIKVSAERVSALARLPDPSQFNQLRMQKPALPRNEDYYAKVQVEGTARSPKFVRGEQPANYLSEMLPEDQESAKHDIQLYTLSEKAYLREEQGIKGVLDWLNKNISSHYMQICAPEATGSAEHDNISLLYSNLKAACGINDVLRKKQARKAYFDVLRLGTSNKTKWGDWINKWEKAMQTAQLRRVVECSDSGTWFEDLERAIDHEFKVMLRIEKGLHKTEIETNTYRPSTFANKFREELPDNDDSTKHPKGKIAKGSFGPTFQGSNEEDASKQPTQSSNKRGEKRKSPSGGHSGDQPQKRPQGNHCSLCEMQHRGADTKGCWVAFPEAAPKWITPTDRKTKELEQRLKDKPDVRKLNCSILDSGTTLHIFNEITRFRNFECTKEDEFVFAGSSEIPIIGYGDVDLRVRNPQNGLRWLHLKGVAYCPQMGTNLVSLRQLRRAGYWWDQRNNNDIIRHNSGATLCVLSQHYDQYVIEYIRKTAKRAAFIARRLDYNSWTARKPSQADAMRWHRRLGHPGPRALEHLLNNTEGARIKGPTTVQCDICGIGKAKRREHREPRKRDSKPGERISIDFHDYEVGIGKFNSCAIITERETNFTWDYYFTNRDKESLLAMLKHIVEILYRRHGVKLQTIETDNELQSSNLVRGWLQRKAIHVDESAPRTQAQNGSGERAGGVVKEKARLLILDANLPTQLWPEMVRTAVYLLNRTPKARLKGKTPYESFLSQVPSAEGRVKSQPRVTHLKTIGCKAFAMTENAQKKEQRLKSRTAPKAWIGYLVGYNSQNIFRIWNPATNSVYVTRDVVFNEDKLFDPSEAHLRETIGEATLEEIQARIQALIIAEQVDQVSGPIEGEDELETHESEDQYMILEDFNSEPQEEVQAEQEETQVESDKYTSFRFEPLPTPPESPASSFLASSIELGGRIGNDPLWKGEKEMHQAFFAGTMAVPIGRNGKTILTKATRNRCVRGKLKPMSETGKAELRREIDRQEERSEKQSQEKSSPQQHNPNDRSQRLQSKGNPNDRSQRLQSKGKTKRRDKQRKQKSQNESQNPHSHLEPTKQKYHRRYLPKAPGSHGSLEGHRFEKEFKEAEKVHLESHRQMNSWIEISRRDPRIRNSQILDCMWVYTYKFDKHGYLRKCKARLVVRGDQQQKATAEDTYAATLAGKSFRTLLAIAARFDLEMLQFDAVNAFVNAKLPSQTFMRLPPGYRNTKGEGSVLLLQKALYGLRIAPLLWQRELGNTLRELNFEPVAHEPCCYSYNGILLFFYVDDIVIAYTKGNQRAAKEVIEALKSKYKLTGGDGLQWFLGMEIIRDRERKLIWVTQNIYLEKIYELRKSDTPKASPMTKTELVHNEDTATKETTSWYRKIIGSILYAAVITRPDIAFAVSRLARFMENPSDMHCEAADRVLNYLYATRFLALQFGGGDEFQIHSDASFADNTADRKSSQAYAMKLFGSLIGWRANKQDTVTTSTTEAELLALAQAAKEGLFQQRLLSELGIELESPDLHLVCDNQQTIGLLERPIEKLRTKLKHVDIHNHWLREHIQKKRIVVSYEQSAKLIADGLTKALQGAQLKASCEQLGLVDIEERIQQRRTDDFIKERSIEEILKELRI